MNKTTQKRADMLAAIKRHGASLLAAFPHAPQCDPDTLARKLFRVEASLHAPILRLCNGPEYDDPEAIDRITDAAKTKARKLLGLTEGAAKACGLFVNRDPRGYALKLSENWTAAHNQAVRNAPVLYTDWGGYGILAPDLTPSRD